MVWTTTPVALRTGRTSCPDPAVGGPRRPRSPRVPDRHHAPLAGRPGPPRAPPAATADRGRLGSAASSSSSLVGGIRGGGHRSSASRIGWSVTVTSSSGGGRESNPPDPHAGPTGFEDREGHQTPERLHEPTARGPSLEERSARCPVPEHLPGARPPPGVRRRSRRCPPSRPPSPCSGLGTGVRHSRRMPSTYDLTGTAVRLTATAHGGGCACKISPGDLERLGRRPGRSSVPGTDRRSRSR